MSIMPIKVYGVAVRFQDTLISYHMIMHCIDFNGNLDCYSSECGKNSSDVTVFLNILT